MSTHFTGPDGNSRCRWCGATPELLRYHDTEWGFPVEDDYELFEKLCLESFQSGLSWRTILGKRDNFRNAFHNFNFDVVAHFTHHDISRLLKDASIVRHRGKIEATINNAKCAQEIVEQEGSLAAFFWQFEPEKQSQATPQSAPTSSEAKVFARNLKKLGWKFVGPTTVFAFMQSVGLINDHAHGCVIRGEAEKARKAFKRPTT